MIKAIAIMMLAGLTFLQGCSPSPIPSGTPSPPVVIFIEITIEAVNATEPPEGFSNATGNYGEPDGMAFNPGVYWMEPNLSISPTPTRQPRKVTSVPTIKATPSPSPTEEPTPTDEPTPEPTKLSKPTKTPKPTRAPKPTKTPKGE